MSWQWNQRAGVLSRNGLRVAEGYSGAGRYKNDPDAQMLKCQGPIPCGLYSIGAPVDTATHGPYVLPLTPIAGNQMFGRGSFLIHGDNSTGTASEGCIILDRATRELVGAAVLDGSEMWLRVVRG